jgi:hypothetical protein
MPPAKKTTAKAVDTAETTVTATTSEVEATDPNSVLRFLLSLNSNKPQLDFGLNTNCRLIKIDNTPKTKEGEIIKRNTFLTFAKYNDKGEVTGQTEFNFFNLEAGSKFVFDNFVDQLSKLSHILSLLAPEAEYDPTSGYESTEQIEEDLKAPKSCKAIQDALYDDFAAAIEGKYGTESALLAVKVVTEKTGKYLQLPREAKFCELMSKTYSHLVPSAYEIKMRDAALTPAVATPDAKGAAPSEKKTNVLAGL